LATSLALLPPPARLKPIGNRKTFINQLMLCSTCGSASVLSEGEPCNVCGATPGACALCGWSNARDANYCNRCGHRLLPSTLPLPAQAGAPLRQQLVERILRSRTALEGERRQVSVLFADVRDSFRIIHGADAEDAAELMDPVIAAMTEAVHRYEGMVNQVLGDGLMALFGAPVAQEDHALRAACAALTMQKAMSELRHPIWQQRHAMPQIRIGLNSGEVVIRTVRTDLSLDYRAIGSTIHMASRLEQLAQAGQVLLSAHTRRLGGKWLKTRSLGSLEIRGLGETSEVFELQSAAVRTRFQAIDPRELSSLAGRGELLAQLQAALRDAFSGQQRTVVISGEPGVGKSRLCYEVLRSGVAEGGRVLEACAPSYGRETPHGVLASLARALFAVDDDDEPALVESKARQALNESGYSEAERTELACELLDLPNPAGSWRRLDPLQRRRRIEDTMRGLLAAWCARGPAILLFEDVHWSDPESLDFMIELVRTPPAPDVLLLVTHRSEHALDLPFTPAVLRFALHSLNAEASERMLQNLVGSAPALAPLRRLLAERAAGNPFFLEESAQSLLERGVLVGERGRYELRGDLAQLEVPATIESLISARVDRLPPETLEALEAIAVAGDEIPHPLLCHVLSLPAAILEPRLWALLRAELVYQPPDATHRVFRMKHALIREVVYRRLIKARRKSLHSRVVIAIEELYKLRLGEHVERLADHSYHAELWEKSIAYHQLACQRALRCWANDQALMHLERGLDMLEHLPEGRGRDCSAVDLRLLALAPLVPRGEHDRMLQLLLEAQTFAASLADVRRQAAVASQLALAYWMMGRHDEAMQSARRAETLASELNRPELGLHDSARHNIAMIHHARGELSDALPLLRELLGHFSGAEARKQLRGWAGYPGVYVRTFAISCLSLTGGFAEATQLFTEGRAVAEEFEHSHSRTMIMEEQAFCLLVQGEPEAARTLLEEALAICERDHLLVMHSPVTARLGVALVECGEVERGLSMLQRELDRGLYRHAAHYGLVYLLIGLSQARLHRSETAAAVASAREAERVTREAGERGYHVCALVQLAAAQAATASERKQARQTYAQALDAARQIGMPPWEGMCWRGLAGLDLAAGDARAASVGVERALACWAGLGAPRRIAELEQMRERVRAQLSAAAT
jgi:class 3 adenylate cyclase/tetratricopeptide (TPR) repeat protein